MKRGFVRAVWGVYDNTHRITRRRYRIDKDMRRMKRNKWMPPFVVYVFGKDNYERVSKFGWETVLLDDDPAPFNLIAHQYRNKLEILKRVIGDYDEMVYLDWDCLPVKPLPDNFWEKMGEKREFQANLQLYHRRKCPWRKAEQRKVPNGGFMYFRDKTLPERAIKYWEMVRQDNDEPAWARLTDELMGGWKGIDTYWDLFEPEFCNLHKSYPYPEEQVKGKNSVFIHYQGGK